MELDIRRKIVILVKSKATALYKNYQLGIDREDIEQELMLRVLQGLEKFDVKSGYILSFVKNILYRKSIDLVRFALKDKRKCNINCAEYDENQMMSQSCVENNILDKIDFEKKIENLRKNYFKSERNNNFQANTHKTIKELSRLNRLLKTNNLYIESFGETTMKNISCIEMLSTMELSKLNESELLDLSDKIKSTYEWTKQLKEKLEEALQAKYALEAKEQLKQNDMNFGTAILDKNSHTVRVGLCKKVIWDQDELEKIYDRLPEDRRKDLFKITYSIEEKAYSTWSESAKEAFKKARFVTYGKTKVVILKTGGKANENN